MLEVEDMLEQELDQLSGIFANYQPLDGAYDELFIATAKPRDSINTLVKALDPVDADQFKSYQQVAEHIMQKNGTTFTVYSDEGNIDKVFPFDLIPRVISAHEWRKVEQGLIQRVTAMNLFLADIYHEQRIIKEGIMPADYVLDSAGYLDVMRYIEPLGGTRIHVAGIDLIRGANGDFVVLEDNMRVPSGVSYVLENRLTLKYTLPRIFQNNKVRSVEEYPIKFRQALRELHQKHDNTAVILTPGPYNSAYFEHGFLARKMGCYLAQGCDLTVEQDKVFIKTTRGLKQVDIIYNRVSDDWLDPDVFKEESLLGVPGLVKAYAAGNVILANAIGNGVADDKGIYPYVPDIIKYYLNEEPILGQVETFMGNDKKHCDHILNNLDKLVVKAVDSAGGYGMLFGPRAAEKEREEFAEKVKASPRSYIAQPVVELSTCPTWVDNEMQPRRVDLRPFVITGKDSWVLPGGLTRVALEKDSYIVNSSQGGGSKDTWVLAE